MYSSSMRISNTKFFLVNVPLRVRLKAILMLIMDDFMTISENQIKPE